MTGLAFILLAVFFLGLAVALDAEFPSNRDNDHKGPSDGP